MNSMPANFKVAEKFISGALSARKFGAACDAVQARYSVAHPNISF